MTLSSEELAEAARNVSAAARDALAWTADPANAAIIGERRSVVERELQRSVLRANRLAAAARRPPAVAFFGPSQVGKSHLIEVLSRRAGATATLLDFPGIPPVDYIAQINPDRGDEATGLVSRFTLRRYEAPHEFPVALQLLSVADVIKILANSYYFEGAPNEYEEFPSLEQIGAHIKLLEARARGGGSGIVQEDVWDIAEYLGRYVAGSELTKRLETFWPDFAAIAPRLSIPDAAQLWSLLWGRHDPLTALFRRLVDALANLDFTPEIFCSLDAFDLTRNDPRSILDVNSLLDIARADAPTMRVSTRDAKVVELARPVVAALTAEVHCTLTEKPPWAFFEHTDLLDFPGYRSRGLGAPGLAHHLQRDLPVMLKEIILRGKVEYLFQRYTAEQDITAMLLCMKYSVSNVNTLTDAVARWVASTHGQSPQDRRAKPSLLFFVFTMCDVHFDQKPSDDSLGLGARFDGRIKASLTDPFGKASESWVNQWLPNAPFTNCFLMRKPNLDSTFLALEDETRRELGILPNKARFVRDLADAFAAESAVRRHFQDPEQAFAALLRLNDGGARYIAEHLEAVLRPDVKATQVHDQLEQVRRRVVNAVAPFHTPTDIEKRVAQQERVARRAVADLHGGSVEYFRFGLFLRGLMIDPADLSDRLYEALMRRPDLPGTRVVPSTTPSLPSAGAFGTRGIALPFLVDPEPAGPAPIHDCMEVPRAETSLLPRSGAEALARSAMRIWLEHLDRLANDELFCRDAVVSAATVREIVAEIGKAASRQDLLRTLVADIARLRHIERLDERLAKATVALEHRLNQFVADLGYGLVPEAERPSVPRGAVQRAVFAAKPLNWDVSGFGSEPRPFRTEYIGDWLTAAYQLFQDNARHEAGGGRDAEQNARLGRILAALGTTE